MASDWIKVRTDLATDPRVLGIAHRLRIAPALAVGPLLVLWGIADRHSVDGVLEGYTAELLDSLVQVPGFAAACAEVKWLEIGDGRLTIPRFDKHNGQSSKARAQNSARQTASRSRHSASATPAGPNVAPVSRTERDNAVTPVALPSRPERDQSATRVREERETSPSEAAPPRPPSAAAPGVVALLSRPAASPPPDRSPEPAAAAAAVVSGGSGVSGGGGVDRWAARHADERRALLSAAAWKSPASLRELGCVTEVCRDVEAAWQRGEIELGETESYVEFLIRRARAYGASDAARNRKHVTTLRRWLEDSYWLDPDSKWADVKGGSGGGAGVDPERIREANLRAAEEREARLADQRAQSALANPAQHGAVSELLGRTRSMLRGMESKAAAAQTLEPAGREVAS